MIAGGIATSNSAQTADSSRSMALTLKPGTLVVASAYPDPPFDLIENGSESGFDIELMRAISAQLGVTLQPVRYSGDDFNGIFDGLAKHSYDAVISGTTITPERSTIVLFSPAIPPISSLSGFWRRVRSRALSTIPTTASVSHSTTSKPDASVS